MMSVKCILWASAVAMCFDSMGAQLIGSKDCGYLIPNITTNEAREGVYDRLVKSTWQQKMTLTPLGEKFRALMLKIADSTDPFPKSKARVISFQFMRLFPYLDQKPDFCNYAQFINASAKCSRGNDQDIQAALDLYQETMILGNKLSAASSKIRSQCKPACDEPKPKITKKVCCKNGFVYDTSIPWNFGTLENAEIIELSTLAKQLYESSNYRDNILALLSYFSNTPSGGRLFSKTNPNIIAENLNLQLGPPVRGDICCKERLKRIVDYFKLADEEVKLRVKNEKSNLLATKCKE